MPRDGSQIGRYRILQLLGHGGMGDVYLATATGVAGFEKPVVLKMLRPQDRHVIDQLREAFIGASLDHAAIVQVLDLGEHEGRYFIVMEYVRGFTLAHVLDDARLEGHAVPLPLVAHVVLQIAEALDHIHGHGLLHRDVSPANILLGIDGRVKLTDFGVAVAATEARGDALVGKPTYLPPECFRGGPPSPAWDVYALGVVLWEALAGRRPFAGDTLADVRRAVLAGPPPLPAEGHDYPPAIVEVAARAIAADPAQRPPTAAALRQAVIAACPRDALDLAHHRRYVRACFESPSFIGRFGAAPDPRALLGGRELTPTPVPSMPDADAPTMEASQTPLRIGLSQAGGSGWARDEGERLAARLGAALARPAAVVVVADYRALVDCVRTGAVDIAWMPPAAYVAAERHGARVLTVTRRAGRPTYVSALFTRADTSIASLDELRGRPIAWVDRESASGYLFAHALLARAIGEGAIGKQHFVGSHRAVCEAVADGWAAAGAMYAILDDAGRLVTSAWDERLGAHTDELHVLAYTAPIPGDNVACRPGLDAPTRAAVTRALTELSSDAEGRALLHDVFRAEALVEPAGDLYADVRATLAAAAR